MSVYAKWEKAGSWIIQDTTAHRIISDICSLITTEREQMLAPPDIAPTFYTTRENPSTAWRQLDHVFASRMIAPDVTTRALNDPDEWGPSDHCRIVIDLTL